MDIFDCAQFPDHEGGNSKSMQRRRSSLSASLNCVFGVHGSNLLACVTQTGQYFVGVFAEQR